MFFTLKSDIQAVLARDPAAKSWYEVLICYPGLHALWLHRLAHRLWRWRLVLLARIIAGFSRFLTGIEIHPGATIGKRCFIDHGMGVVIGETTVIGDDVTLYHGVTLGGTSFAETGVRHPQIGHHVVIGAGATLLGPIAIGDYARIGSNAVVLKDVAAHSTVVGVPAKEARAKRGVKHDHPYDDEFVAYGTDQNAIDPLQYAIDHLTREVKALKAEVKALKEKK